MFTRKGGSFRGVSFSILLKENVVLYFSAFPLFLFVSFFPFRFEFFCRDSDRGTLVEKERERKRDEEKGKEKEGKETRQKVGTIQLVVRVSQPLN